MQPVARLRDLREGTISRVRVGRTDVVLVRTGQDLRAFGASCPHAGAPLEGGAVCHGRLICPWHKAEFRVSDGAVMEPPALEGLIRYPTRLDGDTVLIGEEPLPGVKVKADRDCRTFAVVGSGAAATAAVAELRRLEFRGAILMIGPEAASPYDRTALSKFVLSGEMKPEEVPPLRDEGWFVRNNVERLSAVVARVDTTNRTLYLDNGDSIRYDCALLAIGAAAKRPHVPGMTLRGVHTLRGVDDSAAILAASAPSAHVVIMGGSFIGLEAASALRKRGAQVTVVTPDSVPFLRQFGPEIGGALQRLHVASGVVFRLETEIVSIEGTHAVDAVRIKSGEVIPTKLVLVGVGVEPATKGLSGVAVEEDGGVAVDSRFRVTDALYAAGDCAAFPYYGQLGRIEHWRVAQQHGRRAAAAMLGQPQDGHWVPFFWTYHYGHRVEYLGHATEWDRMHIAGDPEKQDFVALQIKNEQVVGVIACQRERTTVSLIGRMRAPLPVNEALALISTVEGLVP